MSPSAETLLAELPARGSGLASFVGRVQRHHRSWVLLSNAAVSAWQTREPAAWAKVRAWLETENIPIIRVENSP
jgi:hypothetical protein